MKTVSRRAALGLLGAGIVGLTVYLLIPKPVIEAEKPKEIATTVSKELGIDASPELAEGIASNPEVAEQVKVLVEETNPAVVSYPVVTTGMTPALMGGAVYGGGPLYTSEAEAKAAGSQAMGGAPVGNCIVVGTAEGTFYQPVLY